MDYRITIKAIKRSYPESKAELDKNYLFWVSFLLRRISFYVTYIFLKLRINAYQASVISFMVGLISCSFLAFGGYVGKIIGALLLNLYIVIDCVDGNIARFNKTTSKFGAFIDVFFGYIISNLALLSIGFGIYIYPESSVLLNYIQMNIAIFPIVGLWIALSYNLTRLISKKYKEIAKVNNKKMNISKREWFLRQFFGTGGFFLPGLLFVSIFSLLGLFIFSVALINTLALLLIIVKFLLEFRKCKINF